MRVPIELTSSVSSGIARYSGGLAGLARCSTPSTGPLTGSLLDDVGDDELEVGAVAQVRDVLADARGEVVDRDDLVAAFEQRLAEVRSDEARAARDDDPAHRRPMPL